MYQQALSLLFIYWTTRIPGSEGDFLPPVSVCCGVFNRKLKLTFCFLLHYPLQVFFPRRWEFCEPPQVRRGFCS